MERSRAGDLRLFRVHARATVSARLRLEVDLMEHTTFNRLLLLVAMVIAGLQIVRGPV